MAASEGRVFLLDEEAGRFSVIGRFVASSNVYALSVRLVGADRNLLDAPVSVVPWTGEDPFNEFLSLLMDERALGEECVPVDNAFVEGGGVLCNA